MNECSFLLIHGLGGSGPQHWQSWLCDQLKQNDYDVHYPTFSNYDSPDKAIWLQELTSTLERIPINQKITVVTHSLGCILWLHYVHSHIKRKVHRAILVAPPSPLLVLAEASSFYPVPLHSDNLIDAADQTMFVHSTNDPYCPVEHIPHYLNLGAPAVAFPNMGHINTASGHGQWSWILEQCLQGREHKKER